jgi:hypothetical protein
MMTHALLSRLSAPVKGIMTWTTPPCGGGRRRRCRSNTSPAGVSHGAGPGLAANGLAGANMVAGRVQVKFGVAPADVAERLGVHGTLVEEVLAARCAARAPWPRGRNRASHRRVGALDSLSFRLGPFDVSFVGAPAGPLTADTGGGQAGECGLDEEVITCST